MTNFDKHKIHLIPPVLQDWALEIASHNNNREIIENYVQKIESVKEYCDFILDYNTKRRKELIKAR